MSGNKSGAAEFKPKRTVKVPVEVNLARKKRGMSVLGDTDPAPEPKRVKHANPKTVSIRERAAQLRVVNKWSYRAIIDYFKTEENVEVKERSIRNWATLWRDGIRDLEDKDRSGRKITVTTKTNINKWKKAHYRKRFKGTRATARKHGCSWKSVAKALKIAGLIPKRCRRRARLSPENIKARLAFAQKNRKKPRKFWLNMITFSDEKPFEPFCSRLGSRDCAWVGLGEDPVTIECSRTGGKLMIWAAINGQGKTKLHFVEGNLNAEKYIGILKKAMPELNRLMPTEQHILQQDGATSHTAKVTQEFLETQCNFDFWRKADWPANSPDLNPIENLWAQLEWLVQQQTPTNLKELKAALKREWAKIGPDFLQRFIKSMPDRLERVIQAKGKAIPGKY